MLQLTNQTTMSSREIAELTKKEHRNIVPVIEQLIDGGVLKNSRPNYYVHPQNKQQYLEYFADKRDSLVIVARLSPEFTAAVIDRWQELENNQPKVPTNFIEAMTLALEQAKQIEQQTLLLEEQKPQVEFANAVANTCDSITIGGYAGLLASSGYDIGQNRLFTWLRDNGYLTTRNNRPSIAAIKAGWLKWIENTYVCPKTGLPKVSGQALITGKGQIYLRKKLIKEFGVK